MDDQKHRKGGLNGFAELSCEAPKVHKKNKSRNSDSSNNCLADSKKTLGNETLQTSTFSGHNGK